MFTDWHTKKMDIRLGVPVKMDMSKCDTDRHRTCSTGLHVGAPGYVSGFGQGGNKKYILACLVNPADVAAVPVDYSFEKMRTAQYYPYAICEQDYEGNLREGDTKYFESDYIGYEMQQVEEKLTQLNDTKANNIMLSYDCSKEDLELLLQNRIEEISVI